MESCSYGLTVFNSANSRIEEVTLGCNGTNATGPWNASICTNVFGSFMQHSNEWFVATYGSAEMAKYK
jgi:hypothetical protein